MNAINGERHIRDFENKSSRDEERRQKQQKLMMAICRFMGAVIESIELLVLVIRDVIKLCNEDLKRQNDALNLQVATDI